MKWSTAKRRINKTLDELFKSVADEWYANYRNGYVEGYIDARQGIAPKYAEAYTADRKTENNSEKPNNCEVKNYCDDCLYTDTCDDKAFFYACTSKATISKMEQVDKDINVRSKDEPKICDTCRYYNSNIPCGSTPSACKEADKFAEEFVDGLKKLKPKDEPQTSPTISKMEQVDEPQTDCAWK